MVVVGKGERCRRVIGAMGPGLRAIASAGPFFWGMSMLRRSTMAILVEKRRNDVQASKEDISIFGIADQQALLDSVRKPRNQSNLRCTDEMPHAAVAL